MASLLPDLLKFRTLCKCDKLPETDPYLSRIRFIDHEVKDLRLQRMKAESKVMLVDEKGNPIK